ncbi:hypothetical protein BDP81DRAFT_86434 [Colletotrichum phormii]|uniref:Uncharacterized protein n=1 Tax=Colletotrichum phormii TaxID=359342 RepID=A0AAJ0EMI5_9PEZI|nr:uncharacterized protein BDP81DRAFT_86434 [Colletotrichum phormii]KAK1654649.1 hypothetical protein BDP81DRAFT_86434 [Colletotrichum phormii]
MTTAHILQPPLGLSTPPSLQTAVFTLPEPPPNLSRWWLVVGFLLIQQRESGQRGDEREKLSSCLLSLATAAYAHPAHSRDPATAARPANRIISGAARQIASAAHQHHETRRPDQLPRRHLAIVTVAVFDRLI